MDKSSGKAPRRRRTRPRAAQPGLGSHTRPRRRQPRLDRLRPLPRPDALARDRRGQRHRRPAAPASAGPSSPSRGRANELRGRSRAPRSRSTGRSSTTATGSSSSRSASQENLRLPDACLLRFSRPEPGDDRLVPDQDRQPRSRCSSRARTPPRSRACSRGRSPRSSPSSARATTLGFRAYDGSHLLHQTKRAATYQNMTAARHRAEGRPARRRRRGDDRQRGPGRTTSSSRTTRPTGSSSGGSRSASTSRCSSSTTSSTSARPARRPATQDITLKWGDNLISFRPRVTGVQQVDQVTVRARNPARSQPFEATASVSQPVSTIGIKRADASAALKGGTMVVADRPVLTQDEADQTSRRAIAAHLAAGYLEAEGVAQGQPRHQGRLEGEDRRRRHELRRHLRRLVVHAPVPGHARLPDDLLHLRPLAAQPRRPDDAEGQARLGQLGRDRDRHEQQRPGEARPRAREVPGARRRRRGLVGAHRRARTPATRGG